MSGSAILRALAVVFVAAMVQTVILSSVVIGGGACDVLLIVIIALALLRGSVGNSMGFGGIVVDLVTLGDARCHVARLTSSALAGRYEAPPAATGASLRSRS